MSQKQSVIPCVLTVAGSDSGAGAGIQADLKTFSALGVYGVTAITAITAQNTHGVRGVGAVEPALVQQQMEAVLEDFPVAAIKLGMLHSAATVAVVARVLAAYPSLPVVLDPVLVSSSGRPLLDGQGVQLMRRSLLPLATLVTPNLAEAAVLLEWPLEKVLADRRGALAALQALGASAVLIKGGHLDGNLCQDLLIEGGVVTAFDHPRLSAANTHGTGCTLASAIASGLAGGLALSQAVAQAKAYVTAAISHADTLALGGGCGPLQHFFPALPE